MRAYVVIRGRSGRAPEIEVVRAAARRALPFRVGEPEDTWSSGDGQALLAVWSNEPQQPDRPTVSRDADGAVGFSGYVTTPLPGAAELLDFHAPVGADGVWSLFAATESGIVAVTCASGAEVVYYAQTADLVVLGNRALLVHLVAEPTGPVADLAGLAGVFNSGYCVTDATAYAGVKALGPGERLIVDGSGMRQVTGDRAPPGGASSEEVAQALVESVAPLRGLDHPVRLGLTGGRDSRLLAALLSRAGVDVTTYTSGREMDPDVVVARQVATRLGMPHTLQGPKGATLDDSGVTVDVRSRLKEAVVLGEGMLSAYDRVGRIDGDYNASTIPFGGSGGEILRGYYAGSLKDPGHADGVVRYMRGRLFSSTKRMRPELLALYQEQTDYWVRAARRQGAAALEEFYVRQRTGRWTGAARSSASIGSLARRPYLDHRVVATVRQVPLADRTSERLVADVLALLAPTLSDVRFAGRRWQFDEDPPSDPVAKAAWEQRTPVAGAHGDQASLNWRTDLPAVRQELSEVILDAPAGFWDLADRKEVESFVTRTGYRSRSDTMKMWHMATIADALTNDFYADASRFSSVSREVTAAFPHAQAGPPAARMLTRVRSRARTWRAALASRRGR